MDEELAAARRALLQNPRDFGVWRRYRRCALRSRAARPEDLDPRLLYVPERSEEVWRVALGGWRRRVQVPGRQRGRLVSVALSSDGSYLAWVSVESSGRRWLRVLELPGCRLLYEGRGGSWSELSFYGPELLVFGGESFEWWSAEAPGRLRSPGSLGRVRFVGVDGGGWLIHVLGEERVVRWPGGEELVRLRASRRPLDAWSGGRWLWVPYEEGAGSPGKLRLDFGEECGGVCSASLLAWHVGSLRLFVWFGGGRMPPPVGSGYAVVRFAGLVAEVERVMPIGHYHSASFARSGDGLRVFCDGVPRRFDLVGGRFEEAGGIGLSGGHAKATSSWRESAWHPFADVAAFRESRSGVVQLRTADGVSLLRRRGVGGIHFGPTGRSGVLVLPARGSDSFRLELWGEEGLSGPKGPR